VRRTYFKTQDACFYDLLAKEMMPKLFLAYEDSTVDQFKMKSLQLIQRLLQIIPQELTTQTLDLQQFTKFVH
jgi:hypothetical protein